jgi:hypothetical protein
MVRRIAWLFAFTGVVLFAAMTGFLFNSESHVTFAAIVLSYLGGIEGGLALREEGTTERTRSLALSLSVIPSLAAWGVLWLPSPQHQIGTAIVLFIVVWSSDLYLARQGLIPTWFVDLRTAITAIACAILGVAYYLL